MVIEIEFPARLPFSISAREPVWEPFYRWITSITGAEDSGLHNRVVVGDGAMKALRRAEKIRLRHLGLRGEALDKALSWSDAGSGPREIHEGCRVSGMKILVLQAEPCQP